MYCPAIERLRVQIQRSESMSLVASQVKGAVWGLRSTCWPAVCKTLWHPPWLCIAQAGGRGTVFGTGSSMRMHGHQ